MSSTLSFICIHSFSENVLWYPTGHNSYSMNNGIRCSFQIHMKFMVINHLLLKYTPCGKKITELSCHASSRRIVLAGNNASAYLNVAVVFIH